MNKKKTNSKIAKVHIPRNDKPFAKSAHRLSATYYTSECVCMNYSRFQNKYMLAHSECGTKSDRQKTG